MSSAERRGISVCRTTASLTPIARVTALLLAPSNWTTAFKCSVNKSTERFLSKIRAASKAEPQRVTPGPRRCTWTALVVRLPKSTDSIRSCCFLARLSKNGRAIIVSQYSSYLHCKQYLGQPPHPRAIDKVHPRLERWRPRRLKPSAFRLENERFRYSHALSRRGRRRSARLLLGDQANAEGRMAASEPIGEHGHV